MTITSAKELVCPVNGREEIVFDYKQRPTTDEYRSGWDRIFKQPEKEEKVEDSGKQWLKPRKQKKSSGPTARSVVQ